MDDWSAAAAWFRQRPEERDREWVERLCGFFEAVAQERAEPIIDDPKTLRIMDRAWRRHVAGLDRAAGSRFDDT